MEKWLDKYQDGGFLGTINNGRHYSPAWGGQFQNGGEMSYYQQGRDFKPRMISRDGSIVKDNLGYWNPENWGKPVEIDSPEITMRNVNIPLLGVSDVGDKKIMLPNHDYKFRGKKVREYPIAQTGKDVKAFYSEYLNSPNYKTRLQKQGYSNPERVISARMKNLALNKFRSTDEGSYYDQSNHTAYIDPNDSINFNTSQDVIAAHELSHGVGNLSTKMKPGYLGLNPLEVAKINNRNNLSNYANDYISGKAPLNISKIHDSSPHEYKADMDAFRYQLKKDKIYDTGTQEFNQELLNIAKKKYKGNKEFERLFKRSKDNELIELMNTIAQNKQYSSQELPIAKYGINELNELTTFANSNQSGKWLNKYS